MALAGGSGAKPPGRAVNLEADVLARYVARALETAKGPAKSDEAWRTLLDENGFTR